MSVSKLLSRIVAPDVQVSDDRHSSDKQLQFQYESKLHDHTYGITSDPLTHFACVFSALIHDAGHRGVPNGQLAKEDPVLATHYKNQAIAEQNSVDVAWKVFMGDDMEDLRHTIYADVDEYKRFRQIVVNNVMATDIFDKELSELRKKRWNEAFREGVEESSDLMINRKATIVIEQ